MLATISSPISVANEEERGSGRVELLARGLDPKKETETLYIVLENRFNDQEKIVAMVANKDARWCDIRATIREHFDTDWGIYEDWSSDDPF